ncbi:MAG: FAD-binding oxidoreductase, partial [Anaerolineales bacterium]|nr:FAD-binding oxidoreductase [Anaerolineales bacterium]
MIFNNRISPQSLRALADVKYQPYWQDDSARPEPASALTESTTADLAIIGAGFTGLWTALIAKQDDPARDVVILEAGETGSGASGRNGGFVAASLTHTFQNGLSRWGKEMPKLIELGNQNLDALESTVKQFHMDCDFIRSGELYVANEPHQLAEMRAEIEESTPYGERMEFLDQDQTRARVNSPTYLAAIYDPAVALVNPARLVWELKRACIQLGVRFYEHTRVAQIEEKNRAGVMIKTQYGQVVAQKVALATNAFPPLLKRLSFYVVPVYDYAL